MLELLILLRLRILVVRCPPLWNVLLLLQLLIHVRFAFVSRSNDVGPSTEIDDLLPDLRCEDIASIQHLVFLIQQLVYLILFI